MTVGTLRLYTGTKTIKATPLHRGAYNLLRGWTIPANEDPKEPGYLVEYQDGGASNVAGFKGYVSWSPQDVFEKAYRLCETAEERVIIEYDDLKSKIEGLERFLLSPASDLIASEQKTLLQQQHLAMSRYLWILKSRLDAFDK